MEDEVIASTGEDEVLPQETEAPVEKSMDDTIRETLDAINKRGDSTEDEQTAADRARDDKGRFAKKDAEPQPDESEPPPSEPVAVSAPTVPPELQKLGLRKDEAEAIASNPAALQAFMRRSEEMHRGLEQYRAKAQFGSQMEQAVSPYMATIQSLGTTPDVAVQRLLAADHSLRYGTPQQKAAMVAKIAQDYGVDLGQVSNMEQAQQYMPDPQVSSLQHQLQQLQARLEQQDREREQSTIASLQAEVDTFGRDKPHFAAVENEMLALLPPIVAANPHLSHQEKLKMAYDQAIYANPAVRAQVLAEQQAAADEARKAEVAQKAQAARKAAAVNMPRRGLMPAARPVGTMDDTIREAASRLGLM